MIKINGQDRKFSDISLKELLEKCNFDSEKVAVELNEEIISKKDFDKIDHIGGSRLEHFFRSENCRQQFIIVSFLVHTL